MCRTGRSVPPTVNQRVPSVLAARSKAALLPCAALPSTAVPLPPRLLLHFHRTADPPIPPQPKQQQIVQNLCVMCRLQTGLMWHNPGTGLLMKSCRNKNVCFAKLLKAATNYKDCLSAECTLLYPDNWFSNYLKALMTGCDITSTFNVSLWK